MWSSRQSPNLNCGRASSAYVSFILSSMGTQIVGCFVLIYCFLMAYLRDFSLYHGTLKGFFTLLAFVLLATLLTLVRTFDIRTEVIRYVMTLRFNFLQIFIHFLIETNDVWVEALAIFSIRPYKSSISTISTLFSNNSPMLYILHPTTKASDLGVVLIEELLEKKVQLRI